jgi:hypothetical protein
MLGFDFGGFKGACEVAFEWVFGAGTSSYVYVCVCVC